MNNQSRNYGPWIFLALPVMWIGAGMATGYEDGMTIFELMGRPSAYHALDALHP